MQKQSVPGKNEKPHRLPDAAFGNVWGTVGSVLDLALDGSGGLGQVTSTGADIFPDTLDGVAGSKAGGGDGKKEDCKEVFHRP
jgi:hypothetical protein